MFLILISTTTLTAVKGQKMPQTGKVTYEFTEEQFKAAKQTADVSCQYYSEGDNEYYDSLLDGEILGKGSGSI